MFFYRARIICCLMTGLHQLMKFGRLIFSKYYDSSATFVVFILTVVTFAQLHTVLHIMSVWSHNLSTNIVTVHQYSETNVMHFLFSLLRIKGLCMFRALLAHPQEAFHKRHFVYCVRVMSVGCTMVQPTDIIIN
jgi:hypothetical protein